MLGRTVHAAFSVLAGILTLIIIAISTTPACAAPVEGEEAGMVISVCEKIRQACIPGVLLAADTTENGRFTVIGRGLKAYPDTDKARLCIWHRKDKTDKRMYEVSVLKNGTCKAQDSVIYHDHHFGSYHLQLTVTTNKKEKIIAESEEKLCTRNYAYTHVTDKTRDSVVLRIVSPCIGEQKAQSVQAVVASSGGKSDRVKLLLTKVSGQTWEATVSSTSFALDGDFKADFYAGAVELASLHFQMIRPAPHKGVKAVALTFDDGPGPETDKLVSQLKKYKSHATFFVVGRNASKHGNTLKAIKSAGCEIGNHSYDHMKLGNAPEERIKKQLNSTNDIIRKYTDREATLVRPPYGNIGESLRESAQAPLILWSIDTLDWETRDAKKTYKTVMKNAKDGDIILMHDIHDESVAAALKLIPELRKKGFELVTVSELAELKGIKLENGASYRSLK